MPSRLRVRQPEINLTSMIDVMSLLMVVFMVTAPLLSTGVEVNLPKGGKSSLAVSEKSINITVDSRGSIYIGKDKVLRSEIPARLKGIAAANPDIGIVISGDSTAKYGAVVEVMGELKAMGFKQVGLKMSPEAAR